MNTSEKRETTTRLTHPYENRPRTIRLETIDTETGEVTNSQLYFMTSVPPVPEPLKKLDRERGIVY